MASYGKTCSLGVTLEVLGERWMLWVLREAMAGTTRFAEFRSSLGIAPDVLTLRLSSLVDQGILERRSYKEPGQRARESYHLTVAGRELAPVLGALQQWSDDHVVDSVGPSALFRTTDGAPVTVCFVDRQGGVLPLCDVELVRTISLEDRLSGRGAGAPAR